MNFRWRTIILIKLTWVLKIKVCNDSKSFLKSQKKVWNIWRSKKMLKFAFEIPGQSAIVFTGSSEAIVDFIGAIIIAIETLRSHRCLRSAIHEPQQRRRRRIGPQIGCAKTLIQPLIFEQYERERCIRWRFDGPANVQSRHTNESHWFSHHPSTERRRIADGLQ